MIEGTLTLQQNIIRGTLETGGVVVEGTVANATPVIKGYASTIAADLTTFCKFTEITTNIVKNVAYGIISTRNIVYVSVFDGSKVLTPQISLVPDRKSGTITISKDITNAIITIITA